MYYDKSSTGAKAYLALAGEILRRDEQAKKSKNSRTCYLILSKESGI